MQQVLLGGYFTDQDSKHYSFNSAEFDRDFSHIPLTFTDFAVHILFLQFPNCHTLHFLFF